MQAFLREIMTENSAKKRQILWCSCGLGKTTDHVLHNQIDYFMYTRKQNNKQRRNYDKIII